ncbi:hypothetical protein BGZ65_012649 [Modicella reniformis]|uniref:Uncharacterized protein n=1 Tax=Modicella reniformis TaxID=1440133 RepID=A0A9P6SNZ2_9FUNG|nr:hypothetical protein BGZ65_012649 [Modicella reniformis]
MDLNWCPVCEQHIPLAWESSLYCSERCKKADAIASSSHSGLSAYPGELQSFPRNQRSLSPSYSPLPSPSLMGVNSTLSSAAASTSAYPSPPTSPMSNYMFNKTSGHGRISPPTFSLGQPSTYDLQLHRKSTAMVAVPQYNMTGSSSANKKGFFWKS